MDNAAKGNNNIAKPITKAAPETIYRSGRDRKFLMVVILLLCMGTVMIFSASYAYAMENYNDSFFFAKRQVLWVLLGVGAMLVVSLFDYRFFKSSFIVYSVMAVALALMVIVLFMNSEESITKGAHRWIYVGPVSIQPSEIMKFAVVLYFSKYIPKYTDKITAQHKPQAFVKNVLFEFVPILIGAIPILLPFYKEELDMGWFVKLLGIILIIGGVCAIFKFDCIKKVPDFYYGVFPYVFVLGIVGVLMILQPHLSGLIIIAAIMFFMMILGGTKAYYLLAGAGLGSSMVLLIAKTMSHSSKRLMVWKNPFAYLRDDGWQPAQSLYAVGSGGFWGVGFGNSRQKHLYLPEPQNDYIFSILCEELGFIGAVAVILVFAYFVYRGVRIALRAPDKFSQLLVMGIITHVALQVLLNIAVITNTIPSTGISLPFFSYGGSSLVILMAEMGVVLSVSRYSLSDNS